VAKLLAALAAGALLLIGLLILQAVTRSALVGVATLAVLLVDVGLGGTVIAKRERAARGAAGDMHDWLT
jgi:hypothetical protein